MDVNDDAGFLEKRGAHASIASRLAPTMVLCRTQNMCSPQITCGSELLAMVVNDDADLLEKRGAHASIASRLAPTMVLCRTQNMCSPVGASLLAKAPSNPQQSSPRSVMSFSTISASGPIPAGNFPFKLPANAMISAIVR
jgi:hypothetical protein